MTDESSKLSSPKTLFAEFPTIALGRAFVDRLKIEIALGPYSINAPTAKGGSRIALQVDSSLISKVNELVTEFEGTPGPIQPTKRQKKEEPTVDPATQEKEGGTEVPVATKSKKAAAPAKAKRVVADGDYKARPHCSCGVYVADKAKHLEKAKEKKDKREHKF